MLGFDRASQGEAGARPGNDTRQWSSIGVVNASTSGTPSVNFATPVGALVSVRLHPSDIDIQCRVASFMADEWHPFLGNEEVLVILPQGHERGGGIIVGRMNNGVDVATTTIAGIDVTQNQTSTRHTVPNYAWEVENGWILRNPNTTAQLALNTVGDWIIACGELHFLSLSAGQGVVLGNANMTSFIQIMPFAAASADAGDDNTAPAVESSGGTILINAGQGKAGFIIDPNSGFIFASTAASVPGAGPVGHVATVEGLVSLVSAVLFQLGAQMTAVGATPTATAAALGAVLTTLTIPVVEAAIPSAGKAPPYGTFSPLVGASLALPRSPDGITQPGLGCAGFLV